VLVSFKGVTILTFVADDIESAPEQTTASAGDKDVSMAGSLSILASAERLSHVTTIQGNRSRTDGVAAAIARA